MEAEEDGDKIQQYREIIEARLLVSVMWVGGHYQSLCSEVEEDADKIKQYREVTETRLLVILLLVLCGQENIVRHIQVTTCRTPACPLQVKRMVTII